MRLRRIELVIIGITLAFAVFMGGFFTGRSWSAVNILSVSAQNDDASSTEISIQTHEKPTDTDNEIDNSENTIRSETKEVPQESTSEVLQQPSDPTTETQQAIGLPSSGDGKININLATQSELTDLPGIGSVLASRIIDYRRQHGDFSRIEDLRNVSGIGEKRYETIQDKITVG